jgi:hypothetical protein
MGTGQYSGKHVQDCSTHFLGMTSNAENSRLDYVLNKYQLHQSDVYTVEQELFHFMFPLYASECTVISLNKQGVESYMKRKNTGSHKAVPKKK